MRHTADASCLPPFQHTAARRRLGQADHCRAAYLRVSTHSRPKAAGPCCHLPDRQPCRFNTQPPEGGWTARSSHMIAVAAFQHTAARRRLGFRDWFIGRFGLVSTHSRPKAAGSGVGGFNFVFNSFNTQPPEGGWPLPVTKNRTDYCFNTQPPEGGWQALHDFQRSIGGFNTQPPEGGWVPQELANWLMDVSTHSRPKAAGVFLRRVCFLWLCFNTQPPEGGWFDSNRRVAVVVGFNTQPPEGGWGPVKAISSGLFRFNTQPPEGGWVNQILRPNPSDKFQHTAARRRLAGRKPDGPVYP